MKAKTNKKEKPIKISKKDNFTLKEKKGCLIAPSYIKKRYGLSEVTDDGIFCFADGTSNKLYRFEVGDKAEKKEAFQLLRGYDVFFTIFYMEDGDYIMLVVNEKTLQEVKESFNSLEKDFIPKLKNFDISLTEVNFQERMQIIHKCFVNGLEAESVSVSDYYTNPAGYKKDFLLEEYDVFYESFLATNTDDIFKMLFVRKNTDSLDMLMRELSELPYVCVCRNDFEPVPDKAVVAFIENTYMGYEKEKKQINKVNPELYDVMTSTVNAEDTKLFTSVGMSILLKFNKNNTDEVMEEIKTIFQKHNCFYEYYFGNILNAYLSFVPFMTDAVRQERLMQGDKSLAFFLSGKGKEDDADIDLSSYFNVDYEPEIEDEEAFTYDETEDSDESDEIMNIFDYII